MPTYEYACPNCGIVEVFQSITEKALTRCPQCKKRKVTRMLSGGAGVIFKGSGFWETDYNRSDDYKKKSKSESDASTPAEPKPQTASQSQPKKSDAPSETRGTPGPAGGGSTAPTPSTSTGDKPATKPPPPKSTPSEGDRPGRGR